VQTRFDSTHRNARKLLNFSHFVTLRVVQQDDDSVLVTELRERLIKLRELLQAFIVAHRVFCAGQAGQAVPGELAFLDRVQALPCKAAPLINEEVVHYPAEPRPGLLNSDKVIQLAECLDQQLLEQILSLGPGPGQAPGKAVKAIKVRPYEAFKSQVLFNAAHNELECITEYWPGKGAIGSFGPVVSLETELKQKIVIDE